jgi:hypothetical protein
MEEDSPSGWGRLLHLDGDTFYTRVERNFKGLQLHGFSWHHKGLKEEIKKRKGDKLVRFY